MGYLPTYLPTYLSYCVLSCLSSFLCSGLQVGCLHGVGLRFVSVYLSTCLSVCVCLVSLICRLLNGVLLETKNGGSRGWGGEVCLSVMDMVFFILSIS